MAKKKIVQTLLKEVLPEITEKTIKKLPTTVDDIAKVIPEEAVGESVERLGSRLTKEEIATAKKAYKTVTQEQAIEAAKTSLSFSEKGLKKQERQFTNLQRSLGNATDALERGDMTEEQFRKFVLSKKTPTEIYEEGKVFASGPAQVLRERQNNPVLSLLSKNKEVDEKLAALSVNDPKAYTDIVSKGDLFDKEYMDLLKRYDIIPKETVVLSREEVERIGKANPDWLAAYAKNIDNPAWQKADAYIRRKAQRAGVFNKLYYGTSHVAKNIALLVNFKNRAWDLGANFLRHGLSVADITAATYLSGPARRAIAKVWPTKKIRAALSMPDSYYSGEAAKNLIGVTTTIFDSVKQTAANIKSFVKNKNTDGYVLTPIGKHNMKINYGYGYERDIDAYKNILPDDMLSIREFLSTDLTKTQKAARGAKFAVAESGYYGAKAPDTFASGSFRGGYILSDSWAKANELVGKLSDDTVEKLGGRKKAVDDVMNTFIALDNGQPLSKSQQETATALFGTGKTGEKRMMSVMKNISETSSEEAAEDVFRVGGTRTLVGKISTSLDRQISKIPVVGKIYDAMFPLVRTTIRMVDDAVSYNPFSAFVGAVKEIRQASKDIARGYQPNMRKVDKAIAKVGTGAALYGSAYWLVSNKFITGKHKPNERKALIDMGIPEDSIFVGGNAYSYRRLGTLGEALSITANILNDIRDINENYEDPSNIYGTFDASVDIIGLFADTMGNVPVGNMLTYGVGYSKTSTPKEGMADIAAKIIDSWGGLFNRRAMEIGGVDYLVQYLRDSQNKLNILKSKMLPRLDCWGHYVKDTSEVKPDPLSLEMWYENAVCTDVPRNVTRDNTTIQLDGMERYYWQRALSHIHDKTNDTYFDAHDRMNDYVFGKGKYKGSAYSELGSIARDREGNAIDMYKRKALKNMRSDLVSQAFDTFLEYKDKWDYKDEEEKNMIIYARRVYERLMKAKKAQEEIEIKTLPVNPQTFKPTM